MKLRLAAVLSLAFALSAFGQSVKQTGPGPNIANVHGDVNLTSGGPRPVPLTPKVKTAPVVSDKLQKDFFKASAEFQGAQTAVTQATTTAQQKQAVLQTAVKDITDVCGADYHPEVNAAGDPVCVETKKPEPAKK